MLDPLARAHLAPAPPPSTSHLHLPPHVCSQHDLTDPLPLGENARDLLLRLHTDPRLNATWGPFLAALPGPDEVLSADSMSERHVAMLQHADLVRRTLRAHAVPQPLLAQLGRRSEPRRRNAARLLSDISSGVQEEMVQYVQGQAEDAFEGRLSSQPEPAPPLAQLVPGATLATLRYVASLVRAPQRAAWEREAWLGHGGAARGTGRRCTLPYGSAGSVPTRPLALPAPQISTRTFSPVGSLQSPYFMPIIDLLNQGNPGNAHTDGARRQLCFRLGDLAAVLACLVFAIATPKPPCLPRSAVSGADMVVHAEAPIAKGEVRLLFLRISGGFAVRHRVGGPRPPSAPSAFSVRLTGLPSPSCRRQEITLGLYVDRVTHRPDMALL